MANSTAPTPELAVSHFRISAPQISAGGLLAFVKTPVAQSHDRAVSEIWVTRLDGTDERRFTYGPGLDSSPRWSPDGKWLAFTSDRDKEGIPQLFLIPADGGEAHRLTDGAAGVSSPLWSPAGERIAFIRPDEDTEDEIRDKKDKRDELIVDERLKVERLYVISPDGTDLTPVSPPGSVNVWDYCWSPDGSALAASTSATPLIADYRAENRLLLLQLDGAHQLLFTYDSFISRPRWSTDGGHIAFLGHAGRVRAGDSLFVASVTTGEVKCLTPSYEGAISAMEWSGRASDRITFASLENLYGAINEIEVVTGEIRSRLANPDIRYGTFGTDLALEHSGNAFALVRSASAEAAEVFVGSTATELRPVTNVNRVLRDVEFRQAEAVEWNGIDGKRIHGLLILPTGGSSRKPCPLILTIHGGPASAFSDRLAFGWHDWGQMLASSGYAVLMPNPRGSIGRGRDFTDANIGDLGGMEYHDLMTGVDAMIDRGIADANRLGVAGWSHGGYLTAWIVTQTGRFRAAVMGAGLSNLVSDQGTSDIPGFNLDYFYADYHELYSQLGRMWARSPLKYVDRVTTPTLILHGERDERVSVSQGREFHRALRSLGIESRMVIYPREAHGIHEREHQLDVQRRIRDWFDAKVMEADW